MLFKGLHSSRGFVDSVRGIKGLLWHNCSAHEGAALDETKTCFVSYRENIGYHTNELEQYIEIIVVVKEL
jgi:uncharacterized protein (DUF927 family)